MKSRTSHTLAALLIAGAVPLAHSQVTPPAGASAPAQAVTSPQPPAGLVDEPVASVSKADEMANAVAQALNADSSLKHSKITVQPDEGNILLTGSTLTELQRMQATKIASSHVGDGMVINTLAHDEVVVSVPPSGQLTEDQEASAAEATPQTSSQPTTEEKP